MALSITFNIFEEYEYIFRHNRLITHYIIISCYMYSVYYTCILVLYTISVYSIYYHITTYFRTYHLSIPGDCAIAPSCNCVIAPPCL